MAIKNQVQLITYPDSLGGDLNMLRQVLNNYFSDVFKGGVHILPPFPSSGDRGFAPLTYFEIEPSFGTWEDIRAIGQNHDILVDLMVNHISRLSPYFQDYLKNGSESLYADMFLTVDKLWEDGVPKQEDIAKMFLRRKQPYSTFKIESTGQDALVWTTFGKTDPSEQIDLDVKSEQVKKLLHDIFMNFKENNVSIVRLDAVGYVIKRLGTSCFFVEPDIYGFLDWIMEMANSVGIELLPELHDHYSTQYKLSGHGFWIYDFILPYEILEALLNKSSKRLCGYLKNRPEKQFTMLDCHDGIPVKPDLDGLVTSDDARRIVDICVERGASLSLIMSDEHKSADGFDVHQIRCSYYSALGCNDDAYLAARAIQFFAPGIPQVYYVGLLAGENDEESVRRTGEGREINRHNFSVGEIEDALRKDVVQRLLKLIRFRNTHPAFNGSFRVMDSDDDKIRLRWELGSNSCELIVDLGSLGSGTSGTKNVGTVINYTEESGKVVEYVV